MKKVRLSTNPDRAALAALSLGDVVYLDGTLYTAREGVYQRVVEDGEDLPLDLAGRKRDQLPLLARRDDRGRRQLPGGRGERHCVLPLHQMDRPVAGAVRREADPGQGRHEAGGLPRAIFVRNGALYLTTVGYGTGALLGRGVRRVKDVHWRRELGLAQAIWVIEVENFGPFLVESDLEGNSLFERENAKIAAGLDKVYEGTRPPVMKRFGETDDRRDEMI